MAHKKHHTPTLINSKVPEGCPQCPEGGYDIISGTRRLQLLEHLQQDIITYYQENNFDNLINSLQQLIKDGLPPSDLDGINLSIIGGELHLECKREKNQDSQNIIQLRANHADKYFSQKIEESDIKPITIKEIGECPLVGPHDHKICNANCCNFIQNLQEKLALINAPNDP